MLRRPVPGHVVPPLLAAAVLVAAALVADPPDSLRAAAVVALLVALASFGLRVAGRLLDSPGVQSATEDRSGPVPAAAAVVDPPGPGAATLLTAAGVFATAGAVLPATLLGIVGHLRPTPFLLVVAALAVVAAALPRVRLFPGTSGAAPVPEDRGQVLAPLARLELAFLLAALAAVAVLVGFDGWHERWTPPRKLDDPSYHLTTVALWTQNGDLRTPKFDHGDRSTAFYPLNGELVAWALIAPLRDSDMATRWNQILFGLLSLAAVAAVARRLGASPRAALLAVVLWASTRRAFPMVLLTAGNDHSTGFYLVALVDAALLAAARPKADAAVYAGVALGLLLGTKYLGLMLAPPVLLLALAVAVARSWGAPSGIWGRRLAQLGWAGAAAVVVGGFPYLRNLVSLGNPVFPAPVELFGFDLPGWHAVTLEVRRRLPEFAIDPLRFLLRRDLFGEVFPAITLPLAVVAPFAGALASGTRADRLARAGTFALPPAMFAIFLFGVHDHRENRYLFGAIALAAVAAAWTLGRLAERGRSAAVVAHLVGAGVGVLILRRSVHWLDLPWWWEALLAVALAALAWSAIGIASSRGGRLLRILHHPVALPAAILLALIAAGAAGGPALAEYRERHLRREPIADWLDRRTRDGGSTIAYVGFNAPYPFVGARLQNRIEIVPLNWRLESRYYRWRGDAAFPFGRGRYRLWLANLETLGVEWVVLDARGRVQPERRWMEANPGRFEHLGGDGVLSVWRIVPTDGPAEGDSAR